MRSLTLTALTPAAPAAWACPSTLEAVEPDAATLIQTIEELS
jgi:hypothetical protein